MCTAAKLLSRKQNSLVCESVYQPIGSRERRLRLQKHFPVDQSQDDSANRSVNNHNRQKIGPLASNSWRCNNTSPEASLRIFTAIKNQALNQGSLPNEEWVFSKKEFIVCLHRTWWFFFLSSQMEILRTYFDIGLLIIQLVTAVMQLTRCVWHDTQLFSFLVESNLHVRKQSRTGWTS